MAYLLKAKQNIEEQDINEFKVKKEKYLQRRKQKRELKETAQSFEPNGVFGGQIAPPILQKHNDESAFIRYCEYIGTFSVSGTDHLVRTEFIRKQLNLMKVPARTRARLLIISSRGIKVTDKKGQSLLMAHALHRISYCTCVPAEKLFCFLSREPRGAVNIQYCHVFTAPTPAQVEELNTLLGNAFKVAHSAQATAPSPFKERIAEKLEEQRALFEEIQLRSTREKARNKKLTRFLKEENRDERNGEMEKTLEQYQWYQPNISREEAVDYLLKRDVGSFLVRHSASHSGSYTLSVRVRKNDNPSGLANYLIETSPGVVKFKGLDKEWSNLAAMVVHHSIMPELLTCTLLLPDKMLPVEGEDVKPNSGIPSDAI